MSIYLSNQPDPAAVQTALENESVHAILLLEMQFASGTLYISNSLIDFVDPQWRHTWSGAGNAVGMSDIQGGVDDLAPYREYTLDIPWNLLEADERGVNGMGRIPDLVGNRAEYVNRTAILYEQVLSNDVVDTHGRPAPVGVPSALDVGVMDTVSARYSSTAAVLTMTVEGLLSRKGAPVFGRLTPRDQARRYPGDKGLDYVPEVQSTEVQWTTF